MIEARHLSKVYSRGLYGLRDLSLSVEKGEFVFLTGPSGAGKSTFLRLLLLQERPTDGEIVVNTHNLAKLTRRQVQEYRRGIGFVFQDFKLIPSRTVLENISFVPEVLGVPVAQQRRDVHGFAGPIDTPLGVNEGIDRPRRLPAADAAIGQVERGRAQIEEGIIVLADRDDRGRRLAAVAPRQAGVEMHEAAAVGSLRRQHFIVARNQPQFDTGHNLRARQ